MAPTLTTSRTLQSYLSDIGVSGRISHRPPVYRLTLSGTGRGALRVEVEAQTEPSLFTFLSSIQELRPFFSEREKSTLKGMLP